jgi:hypothetical protein
VCGKGGRFAPIIAELQAGGATSLKAIALALGILGGLHHHYARA